MLPVFRAFDRKPLAEVPVDDAAAMEAKLQTVVSVFKDKARRCAARRAAMHFAEQIAREGASHCRTRLSK
jgi:hypothetical protein